MLLVILIIVAALLLLLLAGSLLTSLGQVIGFIIAGILSLFGLKKKKKSISPNRR